MIFLGPVSGILYFWLFFLFPTRGFLVFIWWLIIRSFWIVLFEKEEVIFVQGYFKHQKIFNYKIRFLSKKNCVFTKFPAFWIILSFIFDFSRSNNIKISRTQILILNSHRSLLYMNLILITLIHFSNLDLYFQNIQRKQLKSNDHKDEFA